MDEDVCTFPDVVDIDGLGFIDAELQKEERDALVRLYDKGVSNAWGYEANRAAHTNFEKRTHKDMRWLQQYTDPFFRSVQQVGGGKKHKRVEESDIRLLLDAAKKPMGKKESKLLQQYFVANPPVLKRFMKFAFLTRLDDATVGFAAVVVAARAILFIACGKFTEAQSIIKSFGNNDVWDPEVGVKPVNERF